MRRGIALCALFVACGGETSIGSARDAADSTLDPGDASRYDGGTCVGGPADAAPTSDEAGLLAYTAGCLVPLGPPPAMPVVACDTDAGADAAECSPPPSLCAGGNGSNWLLFYDDGVCTAGQCVWQYRAYPCSQGCAEGACLYLVTTPG